jgi:hypothetical protein
MKFLAALVSWTLFAAPALHLAEGPGVQSALDHISADSLRGNLSFLASDALEGRDTPSRGLDIAAEFIASQFRRAGLEAPIDKDYFQYADFVRLTRRSQGLTLAIGNHGETLHIDPQDVTVARTNSALDLESLPIYKLASDSSPGDSSPPDSIPNAVAGKAVLVPSRVGAALMRSLREKKVALILRRRSDRPAPAASSDLLPAEQANAPSVPVVSVRGDAPSRLFDSLPDGLTPATLSIHAPAPQLEPVKLRNVIGVLRGSDPELKDTCIIVSAHYDHLGMKPATDDGDRIYNGANDDGSGVVSVIELAAALSTMHPHPRRSIVFMTVFGEERGLLGSQYYSRHPVFPLDRTVADVNIEQIGRTDDNESPQIASATFTGFTYSDLPALFAQAGKTVGVNIHDRNPGDDPYFARSDNQALADAGIPSHTVAVALEFPDYHQVGDKWYKIDYNNMTGIDRVLGLGIISLADDSESPKWNESNRNTRRYVAAWRKLHSGPKN